MSLVDMVKKEIERQNRTLCLIASENYASKEVLRVLGTPLSNKYSEGYPGKRYYAGNEIIDGIEEEATELAKKLFNAEHANVQPHAGAIANFSVYLALLRPGDKVMGLALDQGGHLTHGMRLNFSGKMFQPVFYYLDRETERLDYDAVAERASEEKPKMIIAGYSAYSREIDFKKFRKIADEVGAYLLADISHIAGLVVAGEHPHPFPYADVVTTTTHKTLRGPRGAVILCKEDLAKDIDRAVFPGTQGGPMNHLTAAKAVCFEEALRPEFKEYASKVKKNAKAMAEALKERGYRVVSGGTDNHLFLIDLRGKGISGKEAMDSLERQRIVLNMNAIPYDTAKPMNPSGIRIGTPAMTTRGMGEDDARYVAELIDAALEGKNVAEEVLNLCMAHPVYEPADFLA